MADQNVSKMPNEGFMRLILLAPFHAYLEKAGIDVSHIVRDFGLAPAALTDSDVFVHGEVIYGLVAAYAHAANDPYLGLHVGENMDISSWPPTFDAAQSARTLGEFFTRIIQVIPREANSVVHSLSVSNEAAVYRVERPFATLSETPQIHAFGVGLNLRVFESAGLREADFDQLAVQVPDTVAIPVGYKGIRYSQVPGRAFEFRFPVAWLHRNIDFHAKLSAPPDSIRDPDAEKVSVVGAFRATALPRLEDLSLGLEKIAEGLGLEPQRLAEALTRLGTTATKEIRRLRVEEAKVALCTTDMSVADIGQKLGYSDPAHFSRFFKGQTGHSPRTYRSASVRSAVLPSADT